MGLGGIGLHLFSCGFLYLKENAIVNVVTVILSYVAGDVCENKLNVLILCFIHMNSMIEVVFKRRMIFILMFRVSKWCKTYLLRSRLTRYGMRTCFTMV